MVLTNTQVVAVELLHWHGKLGGTLEKLGQVGGSSRSGEGSYLMRLHLEAAHGPFGNMIRW